MGVKVPRSDQLRPEAAQPIARSEPLPPIRSSSTTVVSVAGRFCGSVNVDVTVVPRSQSPGEGRVCRLRGTRGCGSPPR